MNPAASGDWEEEDAARTLLQRHVADIHPTPDLIDRVEAGIRHRRKTRRIMLPVTMVTAAACVVALAFAIDRTAAPATHVAQAARPVVTLPEPAARRVDDRGRTRHTTRTRGRAGSAARRAGGRRLLLNRRPGPHDRPHRPAALCDDRGA
jgi:hypothetical protein